MYVFGGRRLAAAGGIAEENVGDLWAFDPARGEWARPAVSGPARSKWARPAMWFRDTRRRGTMGQRGGSESPAPPPRGPRYPPPPPLPVAGVLAMIGSLGGWGERVGGMDVAGKQTDRLRQRENESGGGSRHDQSAGVAEALRRLVVAW
jgi:hypothetical protein